MVYRFTCKHADNSKQTFEHGFQGEYLAAAMSDLEEGEIEDGELPSTEPQVSTVVSYAALVQGGVP